MSEIAANVQGAAASRAEAVWTIEQINTYFLDLERLLDQVERATTHYETLGVDRSALHEQVLLSYREAVALLYPPYNISADLPDAMIQRIERCFNKTSQAMMTLAGFKRRKQYESALLSLSSKPVSDTSRASDQSSGATAQAASADARRDHEISINRLPQQREVYKEFSRSKSGSNRRRCERYRLAVPVRAVGYDKKNGKWNEMAETLDVSRTGVTLRLRKGVRHGTVLYLNLPLPTKLRSHGYSDSSYKVYALVRRVEPPKKGMRVVALEFVGEHPPVGFLDKPWAIFRTGKWAGSERRRAPRVDHLESLRIEYLSESSESILIEEAKTENVSRTGLRVLVRAAPHDFDLVRVSCARRNFESFATVRNRYVAKDGVERLCLQLVDRQWPF